MSREYKRTKSFNFNEYGNENHIKLCSHFTIFLETCYVLETKWKNCAKRFVYLRIILKEMHILTFSKKNDRYICDK